MVVADFNGDRLDDFALPTSGVRIQFSIAEPGRTFSKPVGVPDISDITAFITGFQAGAETADIAASFGVFDLTDIVSFVETFTTGCD